MAGGVDLTFGVVALSAKRGVAACTGDGAEVHDAIEYKCTNRSPCFAMATSIMDCFRLSGKVFDASVK